MFKIDKVFVALVVGHLAACELEKKVARRRQSRLNAIDAKWEAEKKELEHRLKLINELRAEEDTSWML
jgi:hypothetical protein